MKLLLMVGIGGMEFFVLLLLISFLIAWFIGRKRKITFWGSFAVCVLLSPLIGLIITLLTKKK